MLDIKDKPQRHRRAAHCHHADSNGYEVLFHWTQGGFTPLTSPVVSIKSPKIESVMGGSLGLHLHEPRAVIARLKEGLTIHSFKHLSDAMNISSARLAAVTNIASRTMSRRKKEGRLRFVESERVFRLASLFDKAIEVLGDEDHARRWFKTPLKALEGKSPLEYSDTEIGAREVEDLLGRLEYGVFS